MSNAQRPAQEADTTNEYTTLLKAMALCNHLDNSGMLKLFNVQLINGDCRVIAESEEDAKETVRRYGYTPISVELVKVRTFLYSLEVLLGGSFMTIKVDTHSKGHAIRTAESAGCMVIHCETKDHDFEDYHINSLLDGLDS